MCFLKMPKFNSVVQWLEDNVRKPMEGTIFDIWVARPVKEKYKEITRRD